MSQDEAVPELTAPVAGVILTLMANLSHSFLTSQSQPSPHSYVSLLDSQVSLPANQSLYGSQGGGARTLFASSLQVVLKGLVQHVKNSSELVNRDFQALPFHWHNVRMSLLHWLYMFGL